MLKEIKAYMKYWQNTQIIKKYPFEVKIDAFLAVISNMDIIDNRVTFDKFPFEMSKQERSAIIDRLKTDGYIEFMSFPSNKGDIASPFFKISGKGLELLFTKGYTQRAIDRDKELKRSSETAFLTRLNILTGIILLISLLVNVLYVFGVITWNLQDSTKNKTEQQVHSYHNDRQNTQDKPVENNSVYISCGIVNDQRHVCND